jgi:hypothetical protein
MGASEGMKPQHVTNSCWRCSPSNGSQVNLGICMSTGEAMLTATITARVALAAEVAIKAQGGGDLTARRETETLRSSRLGARTGARDNGPDSPSL